MNLPPDHLVNSGVTVYNRTLVEDVEFRRELIDSIQPSIALLDERTSSSAHTRIQRRPSLMPEMFLPAGAAPLATALSLGKAVTHEYGSDFVVVDTSVSSVSEEATAKAERSLRHHCDPDFTLFAFLLEQRETDMPLLKNPRIEQLRKLIEELPVAAMCIIELVDSEAGKQAPPAETSSSDEPGADGQLTLES